MNATDMNTGKLVERPIIDSAYKYDLDLKPPNSDAWLYIGSSNIIEKYSSEKFKNCLDMVSQTGGSWRIIEAKTGKIIRANDKMIH